jgi:hypothetical protein
MKVKERNRLAAAARMIELEEKERLWELEMDQRIITESALIRAEWCDVVRETRRVQKVGPLEIPVSRRVAGCPKGKEFE